MVRHGGEDGPQHRREQPMRIGHVVQIQRIHSCDSGRDPDLLDPKKHKDRPKDVEQLDSEEQDPQGNPLPYRFSRETGSVVTDKHWILLFRGAYSY